MLLSENLVKSTFIRNTAAINLDLCRCRNFNLFVHLCVTPVTLQMTESLMEAFKLTNAKNETESANQI